MTATKSQLIDPKDLVTVAFGVAIACALMVGFWVMSKGMGMATFVDHSAIPHQ